MALKPKHHLFIKKYLLHGIAEKAAMEAGAKKNIARTVAWRLLKNVEVQAEIKRLREKSEAKVDAELEAHGITKERWLKELGRIAFANMDEFVRIELTETWPETTDEQTGEVTPARTTLVAIPIETKKRAKELGSVIKKISETKNGIGIELHSKQGALELLAKHFGWVQGEGDGTKEIKVSFVDEKKLKEAYKKLEDDF